MKEEERNMSEQSTFFLVREEILPEAIKKLSRLKKS